MTIDVIDTGYFYADGGAMFGAIPKTSWEKRYPATKENGCVLAMRSLLVQTDDGRNILIDTGAGNKHLKLLSYYRFFDLKDLPDELRARGLTREDITDVVLTHLHFDHCGYVTNASESGDNQLELTFPKATHWVGKAQWDSFIHPHPLEEASFLKENMTPVAEKNQLQLIDTDTELAPGVQLVLYDGHTKGQIVPSIRKANQTYVFAGDVIPLAASVSPHWISAYDTEPMKSYDEKIRLLEQAASSKQWVFFCHDAYTKCATIKKVGKFFKADQTVNHDKY